MDIDIILEILSLPDAKKALFHFRYINVLREYNGRALLYARAFHTLRVIVGVGSLFVPALLSIQQISTNSSKTAVDKQLDLLLYWCTWVLSLMVTMSNGMLTLFKVDKKYYFMHTLVEQMRSEGWQFLTLTGRYALYRRVDASGNLCHDAAFGLFCHMVEKIKMHQVEEEYFKLTDDYSKQEKSGKSTSTVAGSATSIQNNSIIASGAAGTAAATDIVTGSTIATTMPLSPSKSLFQFPRRGSLPGMIASAMPMPPSVPPQKANTGMGLIPITPQIPLDLDTLPPDIKMILQELIDAKQLGAGTDTGVPSTPKAGGAQLKEPLEPLEEVVTPFDSS